MSVQVAMMAGMAAMAAASAVQKGQAEAAGYAGAAKGAEVSSYSRNVEIAENKAQAQNEELQRRTGLQRLMNANRADLSGRGVSGEQGSSFDVIGDYNTSEANRDIGNIRFMGESRVARLSFAREADLQRKSQLEGMAGSARLSGWLGAARSIGGAALSYFGSGFGGLNSGATGSSSLGPGISPNA